MQWLTALIYALVFAPQPREHKLPPRGNSMTKKAIPGPHVQA